MDFSNVTALKDFQKQLKKEKEKQNKQKTPDGKRMNPRIHGLIESEVLRKPVDILDNTTYEGTTKIFLTKVPLRCNSERYDVTAETLREWIIYAVIEEDPHAQMLFEKIQSLNEMIDDIEENLKKIPKLQFMDELGKPLNEDKAREERNNLYEKYGSDRVVLENQLEDLEQDLKRNVVKRRNMGVELIQGAIDYTFNTSTWSMKLSGSEDVDEIEDLLMQKMNWGGIKLAVGDDRRTPPMPPWAGRGDIPDGSNLTMPDYSHLIVNMLGVRIMRLPSGVGLAKALDRKSSSLNSEAFGMYYGEFDQGVKDGYGINISDIGVYTGSHEKGFRNGKGRLDLADGTTMIGHFSAPRQSKLPECIDFNNPYKEGELHGECEIYFADGGYYRGHVEKGIITGGKGDYQSAFSEISSGQYLNGTLHGDKCFEKSVNGQVKLGQYQHGELHGFGTVQTRYGDNFDGYFEQGMKHGRGAHRMKDQGVYRGYFFNDTMHGKASLEYNMEQDDTVTNTKSKSKPNQTEEKKEESKYSTTSNSGEYSSSPFSAIFQGYFLAGNIANKGLTMTFAKQAPRIISRKDPRKLIAISDLLSTERQKQVQQNRLQEKYSFMEQSIREEVVNKKSRIFRQQRHLTKKMMYNDDMHGYDERFNNTAYQLKTKAEMRKERFNRVDDNEEFANKKALVPRLRNINRSLVQTYSKAFERLQPEQESNGGTGFIERGLVNEDLVKYALVDFEEARERQRLLKYDLIWQRAEDAFIKSKTSDNETKL